MFFNIYFLKTMETRPFLSSCTDFLALGEGRKRGSRSRSGSRKNRTYSIGLGRSQSGGMSEEAEDAPLLNSRVYFF